MTSAIHKVAMMLDRRGGRTLLGFLATLRARAGTEKDIRVFYDDGWIQQVDTHYLVTSRNFVFQPWGPPDTAIARLHQACSEYWFHLYTPRSGDVIIDVGAGNGSDVIVFADLVGEHGRVIAIEAHPATFRLLRKQCELNGLRTVIPLKLAVTDTKRMVYIDDCANDDLNRISSKPSRPHLAEAVQGVPLDQICREQGITRVDLLKMNIEGAERYALDGMEETLFRTRHVCIACHDFLAEGSDREELRTRDLVIERLRRYGFHVTLRSDDFRDYVRYHVHGARLE